MTNHALTLGTLLLTGSLPDDDHDFVFNVLADGVAFGTAAGVREVVTSLLADGDLVRTTRFGNREVTFAVQITGPDLASLAHGEAALRREVGRGNTLTWQPPDAFAAPTVFEVLDSDMAQTFKDLDDLARRRTFNVTLTCAPFARSANLTTITALEVGASASTVTIDTCDSATGWTGTHNGYATPVVTTWEAGAVSVRELVTPGPQTLTLTRAGAVDFSTTRYLVAEIGYNRTLGTLAVTCVADGVRELTLLETRLISPGRFLYTYDTAGVSAASTLTFSSYTVPDTADLSVFNLARSNRPPGQTARQPSRIIEVGGTERTPGSLQVSAPNGTSPLGLTLVATWPENGSGFSPPLRRWRVGGNTETVDAATFSGKREPLGPAYAYFDIPIESLPVGTYQLMTLMRASVAGDYLVESVIQSRHDGVVLGETQWGPSGTETVNFPLANDWKLVPMGVYGIPIAAAMAGEFRILIKTPDSTAVEYDEAWLFPVDDDCALSAALVTEPHLWLDSADLESRAPHIWEGAASDKSDAHFPANGIHTMGHHVFVPSRTAVFTATHGVDWPDIGLDYHKRWHSNAAED